MPEQFKTKILYLLLIPAFLYVSVLHIIPLLEPDETRYSEIADTMIDTGDYITPHLNHVVYLEKPPLAYWVTAGMFKIFGENEFSARLFTGLCTWGCILLCYAMGAFLHDERTGLYSASVFSTFLYVFILGRINILDVPLTFFVSLAIWGGYLYLSRTKPRRRWIYLLYTASALAFLTKGLIGILFPFAILGLWLLISNRRKEILRLFSARGLMLMLLLVSPWLILVQMANKDFLWFFFVQEHFLRYASKMHDRYQPFIYYLPVVLLGGLPWLAFLIQTLRVTGWNVYKSYFASSHGRFFIVWIVFILSFFSFSSSKLVPYIAPVFLPLAVIFARMLKKYDDQPWQFAKTMADRVFRYLPVTLQSALFIGAVCLPLFIRNHTELGGDLMIVHSKAWIWLIIAPIVFQILLIFVPGMVKRRFGSGWFPTIYFLSALFYVSLLLPASAFLTPYKTAYPLALAIKNFVPASQQLYQYKMFLYGIESYNDIRTAAVADFGEMTFGMNRLPSGEKSRYFLTEEDFLRLCKERKGPVLLHHRS